MTCRDLLQALKSNVDTTAQIEEKDIKMIVHGNEKDSVARLMVPIEDKIKILEVRIKEVCVYEGLNL